MDNDTQLLLWLGLMVCTLTLLMEGFSRKNIFPQWLARKFLHLGAVGACAWAALGLEQLQGLIWIVAGAEVLLLFLVGSGLLFNEVGRRKSWGIALFPLPFLLLLMVFPQERWLIALPMLILAISDAAAAIFGLLFARRYYQLTGDRKSIVGSVAFVAFSMLLLVAFRFLAPQQLPVGLLDTSFDWIYLGGLFLLLALVEAFGSKGWDNFFVPLAAALLLRGASVDTVDLPAVTTLWVGLILAGLFAYFALKKKWLTLDGALMAGLLGVWVVAFAGFAWLLPLLAFFGSSMLLGRLPKVRSQSADAKQGKPRDYLQVLCNGGIYGLLASLLPFFEDQQIFLLMLLSMAVSTADTWSSEIGIFFRGKTIDILRLRPAPVGLSGGISLQGTVGGLLGAAALAGLIFLLPQITPTLAFWGWLTLGGTAGMLLDSILGASIQGRYFNEKTRRLQDTPLGDEKPARGYAWATNDLVNLMANAGITGLFAWWWLL